MLNYLMINKIMTFFLSEQVKRRCEKEKGTKITQILSLS